MVRGPLPQEEYESIFSRVPRLTVEVVIIAPHDGGVLLSRRLSGPCKGLWHIPGGTVRFGETLTEAARRVPRQELGLEVSVGSLIGYIEYPSHLALDDWPVGIAFRAALSPEDGPGPGRTGEVSWFRELPAEMHEEQRTFLSLHHLVPVLGREPGDHNERRL